MGKIPLVILSVLLCASGNLRSVISHQSQQQYCNISFSGLNSESFSLKIILSIETSLQLATLLGVQRLYLSIHKEVSHQSHGLSQGVPLSGDEGFVLIGQAARPGHNKLSNLVVQVVERLDRCKGSKRVLG